MEQSLTQGALPEPREHSEQIESILRRIRNGSIVVDTDFQRDVVWNNEKQSFLIDSIFKNFVIPPLIFSVKVNEVPYKYVCIDGKQRLTAIRSFIEGKIPSRDPQNITPKKYYKDLTEQDKARFNDVTIRFCTYTNLSESQEIEIFNRVQFGIPLTVSEKLNAHDSPVAKHIKTLLGASTFNKIIHHKRCKDVSVGLYIAYIVARNADPKKNITQSNIKSLLKEIPENIDFRCIDRIFKTMDEMQESDPDIFNKTSPVEFLYCAYLIHRHPDHGIASYCSRFRTLKELTEKMFPGKKIITASVCGVLGLFVQETWKDT